MWDRGGGRAGGTAAVLCGPNRGASALHLFLFPLRARVLQGTGGPAVSLASAASRPGRCHCPRTRGTLRCGAACPSPPCPCRRRPAPAPCPSPGRPSTSLQAAWHLPTARRWCVCCVGSGNRGLRLVGSGQRAGGDGAAGPPVGCVCVGERGGGLCAQLRASAVVQCCIAGACLGKARSAARSAVSAVDPPRSVAAAVGTTPVRVGPFPPPPPSPPRLPIPICSFHLPRSHQGSPVSAPGSGWGYSGNSTGAAGTGSGAGNGPRLLPGSHPNGSDAGSVGASVRRRVAANQRRLELYKYVGVGAGACGWVPCVCVCVWGGGVAALRAAGAFLAHTDERTG